MTKIDTADIAYKAIQWNQLFDNKGTLLVLKTKNGLTLNQTLLKRHKI